MPGGLRIMHPDDELCLCFHVTRRKLTSYLRICRPRSAGQLSECQGAGTGCGWCRPFLERMFEEYQRQGSLELLEFPDADQYAQRRADYREQR
jgi:NAD(P)H-nitrite reductase large subunit